LLKVKSMISFLHNLKYCQSDRQTIRLLPVNEIVRMI